MAAVTTHINQVYAETEGDLWVEGRLRTSTDDVRDLTSTRRLVVARDPSGLVGCVEAQRLDEGLSGLTMLVVIPQRRGVGLGRRLVEDVERWSLSEGRTTVQLDSWSPVGARTPWKDRLASWYVRMGYRAVRSGAMDDAYPELGPLLATPCTLVVYQKQVRRTRRREAASAPSRCGDGRADRLTGPPTRSEGSDRSG